MNMRRMTASFATALLVAVFAANAYSQDAGEAPASPASPSWHSDNVVLAAGVADVKPHATGILRLTASALDFSTKDARGQIPFDRITAVSPGAERVATGGTGAGIARKIPFFGIGAAVGAATNRSVDLLTVEYRDRDGGYHGAVFEVPKTQAAIAQQQLAAVIKPLPATEPATCSGPLQPGSVMIEPIAFAGIDLPAEYRVLLYEQLVDVLKQTNPSVLVYRLGDGAAPCAATKLQLSVMGFKKGNEAVRASTGPVGWFAGTTSVRFGINLVDSTGKVLFDKSLKTSKHGDGDSLSVTRDLAKSVSRRLAKSKELVTPSAT